MSDEFSTNGHATFTTSRGKPVTFLPIATLLDKIRASHPLPEPPTYEFETAGGAKEKRFHDETTLDTPAEKAAWAEYQTRLQAANEKLNRALTRAVLLRGVTFDAPADDPFTQTLNTLDAIPTWVAEQKLIDPDILVPIDPVERRLHYIETELLVSLDDYERVMLGTMEASGVPEELLQQMEASFRRSLGRRRGNATQESGTPEGAVVAQSAV